MVENRSHIKSGVTINVYVTAKIRENICVQNYIWSRSAFTCENGQNFGSIVDDSVITHDESY